MIARHLHTLTARLALALALMCGALALTPATPAQAKSIHRQLKRRLIPAKLVMEHADALKLTDAQREKLRVVLKDSQSRLVDLRFVLETESQKLLKMLDADQLDAPAIKAQASKVMGLETKLKTEHLSLMLAVHAVLTPEQRAQLKKIAEAEHARWKRQRGERGKQFKQLRDAARKRDGGF